jgi:predicted RNase H-like HicB family nuclease
MKIKIVVHEAEEGGFWAEVLAIPGCATQGDSMDELTANLREAIEGCLSIEVEPPASGRCPAASSPGSLSGAEHCFASLGAITSMGRAAASSGFQSRSTATNR